MDRELRAMDIGPRIVDLLLALPEPNQRWLVLLGPWSVGGLEYGSIYMSRARRFSPIPPHSLSAG